MKKVYLAMLVSILCSILLYSNAFSVAGTLKKKPLFVNGNKSLDSEIFYDEHNKSIINPNRN